ncbi:MAG: minor capsid protein [Actinomycetota bacterium]
MTLLEEFAQLLHDRALGVFHADGAAGGTIFLAALPTSPDRCKAVALYGGVESDSRLDYDEPRLQVRCRGGTDPRQAETDAQAVYDVLHGLGRVTLAGGTWLQLAVGIQAGPAYIGRDQNGRHEYVVNVRAEISRPTLNRV